MKHVESSPRDRGAVLRARCPQRLKERVIAHAAQKGHDASDVVRQAVIEFLDRIESTAKAEAGR